MHARVQHTMQRRGPRRKHRPAGGALELQFPGSMSSEARITPLSDVRTTTARSLKAPFCTCCCRNSHPQDDAAGFGLSGVDAVGIHVIEPPASTLL